MVALQTNYDKNRPAALEEAEKKALEVLDQEHIDALFKLFAEDKEFQWIQEFLSKHQENNVKRKIIALLPEDLKSNSMVTAAVISLYNKGKIKESPAHFWNRIAQYSIEFLQKKLLVSCCKEGEKQEDHELLFSPSIPQQQKV